MVFYPYPLGLPRGTVRATVTLLFLFSTSYLILIDKSVPISLVSTFTILIALYYGMRKEHTYDLEGRENRREAKGQTAFNLPAFTVRILIFLIFIVLSIKILYFGTTDDSFSTFLYKIVYIISGFILGTILGKIGGIFGNDPSEHNLIEKMFFHGKAFTLIVFCLIMNYFYVVEFSNSDTEIFEIITTFLIGFYFGNR